MTNVISADLNADRHYKHSGFSNTITDSYASPSTSPMGITWDGSNVISADLNTDKHYKHSGFSNSITDSYASPSTYPTGITWDGTNVISADFSADKHYKHSGFSNSITDSYASPSADPTGITWDGTNVISADSYTLKHYKHSGFSSSITDSYASPSSFPMGITWDGTDVISADFSADKHYKHSGFSNSITDSYASPSADPTGITWDGRYTSTPKTSSDTGTGADVNLDVPVSILKTDNGVGLGAISEQLSSRSEADTGAGVDALIELLKTIAKSSSDTGLGADAFVAVGEILDKWSSDTGSGIDAKLSLLAEINKSEVGASVESIYSRSFVNLELGVGIDASVEVIDVLSEEGVSIEFGNFTQDFTRLLERYGRTLLNHNTNERFKAVFKVLSGTKCLSDNRMMKCGDAIVYVLPTFGYNIGDVVSPVLGRGKYTIVAERYASRIGNLRIFRVLGLERYTPGDTLTGTYDISLPIMMELESSYSIISQEIRKELVSKYDIVKTPAQVAGERAVATGDMIDNYWNPWDDEDLSYYKVHRSLSTGFGPSDANLVGVITSNSFKHSNLTALTQYYFKVCAVTKLGISGSYSAQFTATTG